MTAVDRVHEAVKEAIISGELPGGEMVSEVEVAASLGVSRTPAREAFLKLESEGLLRLYPRRGALVVPIAADEAENVVRTRHLLEVGSAAAIPEGGRRSVVEDLSAAIDRMRRAHADADHSAFAAADADFHRAVVVAGGNPIVLEFYDRLRDRQRRMTALSVRREATVPLRLVEEHTAIVDVFAAGDIRGFSAALWDHMRRTHDLPMTPTPEVLP